MVFCLRYLFVINYISNISKLLLLRNEISVMRILRVTLFSFIRYNYYLLSPLIISSNILKSSFFYVSFICFLPLYVLYYNIL